MEKPVKPKKQCVSTLLLLSVVLAAITGLTNCEQNANLMQQPTVDCGEVLFADSLFAGRTKVVCRDSTLRSALDNCPRVGLFLVPFTESSVEELASIDAQVRAVLQQHGVERIRLAFPNFNPADTLKVTPDGRTIKYNVANVFVLRLAQANDRRALIKKLTELPGVVYAEPNIKIVNRGSLLPTDPSFLLQWNMENSNDTDSDAIAAWGIHTGSANDIIGIVDDGNVMTPSNPHSEFSGRVIYGDATPVIKLDGTGLSHAALVAGIAAAKGNGGILNVAATTKLDEKADYSLPKPFVDVAAPAHPTMKKTS